jgi:hypothetical protein
MIITVSVFLWVFPVYAACICLLLFQCEFVHLHNVFVCYVLYIKLPQEFVCVYVLIACS